MSYQENQITGHGHRWTDAELREFIALWMSETPSEAIAKRFGVSVRTVYKICHRLRCEGVPLKRRNQSHLVGRQNKPWTQEEVEYLVRRRNEKATASAISLELDRSANAVSAMISKLRSEGAPVRLLGHGVRRLWSPSDLRLAVAGRGLRVISDELDEVA